MTIRPFRIVVGLGLVAAASVAFALQRQSADAAKAYPNAGWTIHIDAKKHFAAHPNEIAHHFCRSTAGGMLECQIYDSDAANAHLVAVETIVPKAVWAKFSPAEQAKWHYHRVEIPKVSATTPDMTPAEAKKLVASMLETYGKVYVLWDPMTSAMPLGDPTITILR